MKTRKSTKTKKGSALSFFLQRGLGGLALLLLVVPLLLPSCLAPYDDRAARDLEVGSTTIAGLTFVVDHGLAAVVDAADGELALWSSAPGLSFRTSGSQNATESWVIEVRNCLSTSELSLVQGPAQIVEVVATELPTTKRYRLELPPDTESTFRLAAPLAESAQPFRVGVLSDVQEAIDEVQDIFDVLNAASVDFVIGAGDLTVSGSPDELARFQREMRSLDVPYYSTLGNHELIDDAYAWPEYFGRANFRFDYRDVRFSFVDSGSATVDPTVYGWLDDWVKGAKNRTHVVLMHIPPVDPIGVRNGSFGSRNEAAKLLGGLARGGVDLTLYGHIHSFYEFENAGIPARISGGGGALPEKFDGVGRHILVVDIDPQMGVGEIEVVEVD